jgi:hypothetical protein
MVILHKYLECERQYALTLLCHIRILLHFEAGLQMNFPYYLWRSLGKMSNQVRRNTKGHYKRLYHHGLANMLIVVELHDRHTARDNFLSRNSFDQQHNERVTEYRVDAHSLDNKDSVT